MNGQTPSPGLLLAQVHLRPARPEEAPILSRIARLAKAHWGYPGAWLDAWQRELTVSAQEVTNHLTCAACRLDEPLGFYLLEVYGRLASLEHLWVLPEYIGIGLGRLLFEHACAQAASLGCIQIEVISDPFAAGFYQRMGAEPWGEIRYELFGVPRVLPRFRLKLHERDTRL